MPVAAVSVEPASVVSAAVIPTVVSVTPIGSAVVSVTVATVAVPIVWTVIRPRTVIPASVENGDGNRNTKGKMNTSASRGFSKKRQSRDDQQEDKKLLHN